MTKSFLWSLLLCAAASFPGRAWAVSCADLLNLVEYGVPQWVLIHTVEASETVYTPADVQCLESHGAPDALVTAIRELVGKQPRMIPPGSFEDSVNDFPPALARPADNVCSACPRPADCPAVPESRSSETGTPRAASEPVSIPPARAPTSMGGRVPGGPTAGARPETRRSDPPLETSLPMPEVNRAAGTCKVGGLYTGVWSVSDGSYGSLQGFQLRVTCLSKTRAEFAPVSGGTPAQTFIADLSRGKKLGDTVELSVRTDLALRRNGTAVPTLGTMTYSLTRPGGRGAMETFAGTRR